MKTKKMKVTKLLLFALLSVLLVCIGVVSASAINEYEDQYIEKLYVYEVTPPASGAKMNFDCDIVQSHCSGRKEYWVETNSEPTSFSQLESGTMIDENSGTHYFNKNKYYTFVVRFRAYRASDYNAFFLLNEVKMNGYEANYKIGGERDMYAYVWLCFGTPTPNNLLNVEIKGVRTPAPGVDVTKEWSVKSGMRYNKYEPYPGYNNGYWVETNSEPTTWSQVKAGSRSISTFRSNKYYTFVAYVNPDKGYRFVDPLTATMDFAEDYSTKTANVEWNPDCCIIWACYGKPAAFVDSVTITGVTAPMVGAKTNTSFNLPNGANYIQLNAYTEWIESLSLVTSDDNMFPCADRITTSGRPYRYDRYYTFRILLITKPGYVFSDTITATINGKTAHVTKYSDAFYVWYSFGKPKTEINSVVINKISAPAEGDSAFFDFSVPSNCGYVKTISGVAEPGNAAWIETDNLPTSYYDLLPTGGAVIHWNISGSFAFKPNKYYTFRADVKATDGYEFSSSLTATIGGNTAKVQRQDGYRTIWYCFGKPSSPVTCVEVTGVTAPVVGKKASYDWDVDGSNGNVNRYVDSNGDTCGWLETSSPISHGGEDLMEAFFLADNFYTKSHGDFTFKADKYYTFFAFAGRAPGYILARDVTSTVNGNPAWTDIPDYGAGDITVVYFFGKPATSSGKTLTSISVVTPPTKKNYYGGQRFDKTGMVIRATYSDGTSENVIGFTVTNGARLSIGQTSVTVSYSVGGVAKTTTVPIIVRSSDAILTGIEIQSKPTETNLKYKSTASRDGLKVVARYSDGTTMDVTNEVNVTGFDATNKKGNYKATVEYEGKTATFDYTVKYTFFQWIIIIILFGWIWY